MIRLPLQSGASVLPMIAIGVGCAAVGFVGLILVASGVVVGLPALLVCGGAAVFALMQAYARRASDLIVGAEEFRIECGPYHALTFGKQELDPLGCTVIDDEHESTTDADGVKWPARILQIAVRDTGPLFIAKSLQHDEARSFEAIAATLAAMGPGSSSEPTPGPADAVRCPTCRAPLVLVDAAEVECVYCGALSPLPEETRVRVREAQTIADNRRLVERSTALLLEQPSARWMNASLASSVAVSIFVIPLGRALGAIPALGALLFGFAITYGMLAERRAFRLVTCDLAASTDGRVHRCRLCDAPLLKLSNVLVRCLYCGADNVVGFDLRRPLAHLQGPAVDIDTVLRNRSRRRTITIALSIAAVLAMVVGAVLR